MESCAPDSTDDASVMDNFDLDAKFNSSHVKIRMGGSTEGISNNKKGVVILFIFGNFGFKDVVNLDFAKISVSLDERNS